MELNKAMRIASEGIRSHKKFIEVVAENIANARNSPLDSSEEPYRRQKMRFQSVYKDAFDAVVPVPDLVSDQSQFKTRYEPGHPAADENGYVSMPNVSLVRELADLREGQQHIYANLRVWEGAHSMSKEIVQLLSKN